MQSRRNFLKSSLSCIGMIILKLPLPSFQISESKQLGGYVPADFDWKLGECTTFYAERFEVDVVSTMPGSIKIFDTLNFTGNPTGWWSSGDYIELKVANDTEGH